jgi:hypothetical protein
MSFSVVRWLRVSVCACVIGVVLELVAAPQHPTLHESAHATDSTILEQLPLDFSVNSGQWPTPTRFVARHRLPEEQRSHRPFQTAATPSGQVRVRAAAARRRPAA